MQLPDTPTWTSAGRARTRMGSGMAWALRYASCTGTIVKRDMQRAPSLSPSVAQNVCSAACHCCAPPVARKTALLAFCQLSVDLPLVHALMCVHVCVLDWAWQYLPDGSQHAGTWANGQFDGPSNTYT